MDWTKGSKWRPTANVVLRSLPEKALAKLLKARASRACSGATAAGVFGLVSAADLLTILNRDDWQCLACGSVRDLTFDHMTPFKKGGTNTADNIQTLCRVCNSSKRDYTLVEWRSHSSYSRGVPWAHRGYMVWRGSPECLIPEETSENLQD